MNKDYLTELRDMAIATGCPRPECEHYEVTVANETMHSLVLTSRDVIGSFERAPGKGHVLRPGESDTFRVDSVHFPWESGAATLRYQMAGTPVGFTAMGGPLGAQGASATVEGWGCEYYACAIDGMQGRTLVRLMEVYALS
ncbi:hypothetical protein I5Q34_14705 [Streptomyces sp. AV19]|uniref:hypothetical protein n=1 Tax=Streptomyces sp. AV19 TaxID=2793068 RepID=UPI0018FE329C|nr:hypothetical protein [Streptomyces sp. AV19]MBH1935508.1 hypothetical protein [Streptomyces sp. AV19]MDG4534396.1 hypothetical protein [Streptomyces sp. AV19]